MPSKFFLFNFVFAVALCLIWFLCLHESNLEDYSLHKVQPFEGVLANNGLLNKAERIFENEIIGPESFAIKDGLIYTGSQGGVIISFNPKTLERKIVGKLSNNECKYQYEERICGKVLGLQFDTQGKLYICDAVFGLLRMDVSNGKFEVLVPSNLLIDGSRNYLTNSVAISPDGKDVYYSVSSTKYTLDNGMLEAFSNPSGAIYQYDVATNSSKVLVKNIHFTNGLIVSSDSSFLIYSESARMKVWKYYLSGSNKGKKEIFAEVPGIPDNFQRSPVSNRFLLGLVMPRVPGEPFFADYLASNPVLRQVAFQIFRLGLFVTNMGDKVFSGTALLDSVGRKSREGNYWIGNTELFSRVSKPYALVIELDSRGEITHSWHGTDDTVNKVSDAIVFDGHMYLGSPYNPYIARIKL